METKKSFLKSMYSKVFIMLLLLVAAFFFSMCIGRYSITPMEVVKVIASHITNSVEDISSIQSNVVMQVRLPRILLSFYMKQPIFNAGTTIFAREVLRSWTSRLIK